MTTEQPDLLRLAIRLQHNPGCPEPHVDQVTGKRDGAPGLLCRNCRAAWFPPARLIETTPPSTHAEQEPEYEWTAPRQLVIPGAPAMRPHGWPTHKHRERGRRR
jgi:hypothetical protein